MEYTLQFGHHGWVLSARFGGQHLHMVNVSQPLLVSLNLFLPLRNSSNVRER